MLSVLLICKILLPVLFRSGSILFFEQIVKMRPVGELQLFSYGADGFVCFCQVFRSLFETEGHAIVIEAHTCVLVDNAVQVIPAVI